MKKLIPIILFLFLAGSANASLYSYFKEQGQNLPSIKERAVLAIHAGIKGYNGTAGQNKALEAYLRGGQKLGVVLPTVVSVFETSLQSSITADATSMTLVSGTDAAGNTLSGYYCFTIDSGTAQNEYACGTAAGTAVTGLLRGIDPITGHTTSSALAFAHRRNADVRITDYPSIALMSRILNGQETIPNTLYYNSGNQTYTTDTALASQGYVNNVGAAGFTAANVSTTRGLSVDGSSPERVGINTHSTSGLQFSGPYIQVKVNPNTIYRDANGIGVDTNQNYTWYGTQTFNSTSTFSSSTVFNGTTTMATTTINNLYIGSTTSQNYVLNLVNTIAASTASSSFSFSNVTSTGVTISSLTGTKSIPTNANYAIINFAASEENNNSVNSNYNHQVIINRNMSAITLYVATAKAAGDPSGFYLGEFDISISGNVLTLTFKEATVSTNNHGYTLSGIVYYYR